MSTPPRARKKSNGCPVCATPASGTHGPFCSQGCRDRDLMKWLGEGYRVPGPQADESDLDRLDREG